MKDSLNKKKIYVRVVDEDFGERFWYWTDGDSEEILSQDECEENELEPTGFNDVKDAAYAAKQAVVIARSSGYVVDKATFWVWDNEMDKLREVKIVGSTVSYK